MYIIAKDGSGDFTAKYRERAVADKDSVRIIGEARDRTVITASGCARDLDEKGKERGAFLSAAPLIAGNNVKPNEYCGLIKAEDSMLC